MVRIIGEDKLAVKQITCTNCAIILEYTPVDIKEYHGKDYSGGPDGKEWINCPRCCKEVIIRSW